MLWIIVNAAGLFLYLAIRFVQNSVKSIKEYVSLDTDMFVDTKGKDFLTSK